MITKTIKKNEKRVSLSVLAATKSIRRSIKFVNKQSKFHIGCHNNSNKNKAISCISKPKMNPIVEKHVRIETPKQIQVSTTNEASTNKISLKERIEMSSNRLAMSKNQIQSIRQRNQFNTPNSVKKTTSTNNEYLNKRFNSAHVNLNAPKTEPRKLLQTAQRRLFNTPKATVQTPSTKNIRMMNGTGLANSAAAAYKTPQSRFATNNNNLTSSKSVKSITKPSRTIDRAKSSVRRSIQILNNANLAKEATNLQTPAKNFRRNLFQNGSKIPLYTGSVKQYPKTEEKIANKESRIMENLTRTTIKGRRSSRYSRLSDIESSCLILTPSLMRQLLSKASKTENQSSNDMKIVEEEDDEPIKVKTIKPSSLIKYLFSEKEKSYNIMNENGKLLEEKENIINTDISNDIEKTKKDTENDKKEVDGSCLIQHKNDSQDNKEVTMLTETNCVSINQPTIQEATIETLNESVDVFTETVDLSNEKSDQQSVEHQENEDFIIIDKNDIPIDEVKETEDVSHKPSDNSESISEIKMEENSNDQIKEEIIVNNDNIYRLVEKDAEEKSEETENQQIIENENKNEVFKAPNEEVIIKITTDESEMQNQEIMGKKSVEESEASNEVFNNIESHDEIICNEHNLTGNVEGIVENKEENNDEINSIVNQEEFKDNSERVVEPEVEKNLVETVETANELGVNLSNQIDFNQKENAQETNQLENLNKQEEIQDNLILEANQQESIQVESQIEMIAPEPLKEQNIVREVELLQDVPTEIENLEEVEKVFETESIDLIPEDTVPSIPELPTEDKISETEIEEPKNDEISVQNQKPGKKFIEAIVNTPSTPSGKKRKYTKKSAKNTAAESIMIGDLKENFNQNENIEEDYSISKTIEIQTDFDTLEYTANLTTTTNNDITSLQSENKESDQPAPKIRKKREKKTGAKFEQQPLEEIANEGRVLTRAQRAKLNQKA